jgi:hypothetical protein
MNRGPAIYKLGQSDEPWQRRSTTELHCFTERCKLQNYFSSEDEFDRFSSGLFLLTQGGFMAECLNHPRNLDRQLTIRPTT